MRAGEPQGFVFLGLVGQSSVGPGQLERNLHKVSPPRPLFQRARFPAAVSDAKGGLKNST